MMTNSTEDLKAEFKQPKNIGLWISIITIVLGIVAILAPSFTTLVIEAWLGFILVSVGASNAFYALKTRPEGFGWQLTLGILYIGTGLILLFNPLGGVLTLTLLLGSFFLTEGVFEAVLAFKLRPQKNWGWVLANGLVTIALGASVWLGWPQDAFWTIGTLVGISVLSTGVSRLMISLNHPTSNLAEPTLPSTPDSLT